MRTMPHEQDDHDPRASAVEGLVAHVSRGPRDEGGRATVRLRWEPVVDVCTRRFVVCFRIVEGGARRLVATRFIPAHRVEHEEQGLEPGRYRFEVGGISPTGSGPRSTVEVLVPPPFQTAAARRPARALRGR